MHADCPAGEARLRTFKILPMQPALFGEVIIKAPRAHPRSRGAARILPARIALVSNAATGWQAAQAAICTHCSSGKALKKRTTSAT